MIIDSHEIFSRVYGSSITPQALEWRYALAAPDQQVSSIMFDYPYVLYSSPYGQNRLL